VKAVLRAFVKPQKQISSSNPLIKMLSYPTPIPRKHFKTFDVQEEKYENRKVHIYTPKSGTYEKTIVYFHGGGYLMNLRKQHLNLIYKLMTSMNCRIILPDYPLAPKSTFDNTLL
jgi:acetyl esterase/lipase